MKQHRDLKASCENSVIIHEHLGDTLGLKATMLGFSIEQQVDSLNEIYKDSIEFIADSSYAYSDTHKYIKINRLKKPCTQIVVPNVTRLNVRDLISPSEALKVGSIVLPDSVSEVDSKCHWINYIERLFIYDTTMVDVDEIASCSNHRLEMIIVKPLKRITKPQIYRIK